MTIDLSITSRDDSDDILRAQAILASGEEPSEEEVREGVARIIEPFAFDPKSVFPKSGQALWEQCEPRRRKALRKADAILEYLRAASRR